MEDDAETLLEALACAHEDLLEDPEGVEYVLLVVKRRGEEPTLQRRALRPYAERVALLDRLVAYETERESHRNGAGN